MVSGVHNRMLALGTLWGLLLAIFPAVLAFGRFVLSSFLISAFICAGFSGAVCMLFAGLGAAATPGGRGPFAAVRTEVLQGLVSVVLAVITICHTLRVTVSGILAEGPSEILDLFRRLAVSVEGATAVSAVFVYTAATGTLLSQMVGAALRRIVRPEAVACRAVPGLC